MIILGLDPSLSCTGWGIVRSEGARLSHVANGQVAWSPDGRFIAAMSTPGQRPSEIFLIQPDATASPRVVITVKSSQQGRGLDWWPDQSKLIIGLSERTADIVLFDQGS